MSLNLSFKDWPFLPTDKTPKNQPQKPPEASSEESDSINLPFFSIEYSQVKSFLQSFNPVQAENLSGHIHLSSFGPCGLFASTFESNLSIFSEDDSGRLTPILMFSPFEKYSFEKVKNQPSKDTMITAIAWSNGHLKPFLSRPILAVSSGRGNLIIYNIKSRSVTSSFNFNEQVTSIIFSSFKTNRFYVGTGAGHFYICEISKKTIEVVKMFDFLFTNSSIIADDLLKSVDFITQDDVNGFTIAIASKDGTVGIITNLNEPSQSKLHVYNNLNFTIGNKKTNIVINFFKFYPNNQNFILVSTNKSSFIFSIEKSGLIPLINKPNIKFISLINKEKDKVIVGDNESLTVWKLKEKSWEKLDVLRIPEILTFSKNDNKIILTTVSSWLTQIEFNRNKLFVTKRIRLMNRKPVDYDFGDGTMAFLTNNQVCLTLPTPESIIQSKFECNQDKLNSSEEKLVYGNSTLISLSFNILPFEENDKITNIGYISTNKLIAWCDKSLYLIDLQTRKITEPLKKIFDRLSNTITQIFFSKSNKIIGMILNNEQAYFLNTNLEFIYAIDFNETNNNSQCIFGSISPNEDEVVFASDSALFFVNIIKKTPLRKVPSKMKFNASFVSWNENEIIIGTEKGSVFSIKTQNLENLNEILKKDVNIIYDSLHITESSNQNKLESIKSIFVNKNNEGKQNYIIIDSNNQGIIVSNDVITIADTIDVLKRFSNESFLVSFHNYNKLIAINVFDDFIPRLPPCFFSTQSSNISFYSTKKELQEIIKDQSKTNSIVNRIFSTNEENHSLLLRNSYYLLNHLLSFYESFNFISSRYFLKLGDIESARKLLLKSNRNDKEYLNNMLIAAFYDSESAKPVVKNLLVNKMINIAVDILLITNDVYYAAQILIDSGDFENAYYVLMLYGNEKASKQIKELVKKFANSLFDKKENVSFGLKLLSSFGYKQEMIDQLSLYLS